MNVTIKDIAKEAGLSISAVSLVLNGKPCRLSAENKQKIIDIAKRHNYSANNVARSLATKKSNMMALIIPDIENVFFASLASRIEDSCRKDGYVLMISSSKDKYEEDLKLIRTAVSHGADGLFVIVSNESYLDNRELLKQFGKLPIPYVMIDRTYDDFACDQVSFINEQGAYEAVKHLLENGHRKIGCVSNHKAAANGLARLQGYRRALEEYGCEYKPEYVEQGDYYIDSGYAAADKLLQTDVTAVFVANDMMTVGFLKRLYQKGILVPKDFSLVSYDDSIVTYFPGVELTSVAQDPQLLGEQAYRLMKQRISGSKSAPEIVSLDPKLVVRNSVLPCIDQ